MMANMNYNQMINLLANPNTGHMSGHQDHYDNHSTNHFRENQYQKPTNHQLLQRNHSLGSQMSSVQHYKIEETSPKQTRNRTKFTDEQIEKLEGYFRISPYRGVEEREWIANKLNITPKQVTVWFQNRRAKLKKDLKKEEEEGNSNNRIFNSMPFSNIPPLSTRTLSDGGATPSPDSTQSAQTAPSPPHIPSPSPQNVTNLSQQNMTGDWQYDIDPNLVTGFDQDSNYDPEAFFNEHLSHLIHTLWS